MRTVEGARKLNNAFSSIRDADGVMRTAKLIRHATPSMPPDVAEDAVRFGVVEIGESMFDRNWRERMAEERAQGRGNRFIDKVHIRGDNEGDEFGAAVCIKGDYNGDGVTDVLIGSPGWEEGRGKIGAYCGATGERLFEVFGREAGERFGEAVAWMGDPTMDGAPDFLVGAPHNGAGGERAGRVYMFDGAHRALLMTFTGDEPGTRFGAAVSGSAVDPNNPEWNMRRANGMAILQWSVFVQSWPDDGPGVSRSYLGAMPVDVPGDPG